VKACGLSEREQRVVKGLSSDLARDKRRGKGRREEGNLICKQSL